MRLFTKPVSVRLDYPLEKRTAINDVLFLDIETTGLSPSGSQIYMIGALSYEVGQGWMLRQWFSETLSSEAEMLKAFFSFASHYSTLVHYNGESFDLPFMRRCALQYGMTAPFDGKKNLDLYRIIRKFRTLFPTERMNQKSMEQFLSAERKDAFTGAELISVYHKWMLSRSEDDAEKLRLHNEEDVKNLPSLLSLLTYQDFFAGDFHFFDAKMRDGKLTLLYQNETRVPKPVSRLFSSYFLEIEDNLLSLTVSVFRGSLLYFFKNYRDYYYLPMENRAIHRSVATFVDPSAKTKATAETAYVVKEGDFIPAPSHFTVSGTHFCFQKTYRETARYLEWIPECMADKGFLSAYLKAVLKESGFLPAGKE